MFYFRREGMLQICRTTRIIKYRDFEYLVHIEESTAAQQARDAVRNVGRRKQLPSRSLLYFLSSSNETCHIQVRKVENHILLEFYLTNGTLRHDVTRSGQLTLSLLRCDLLLLLHFKYRLDTSQIF